MDVRDERETHAAAFTQFFGLPPHYSFVKQKPKNVEDELFKHSPEHIQKLQRQARKEARTKARKAWREANQP